MLPDFRVRQRDYLLEIARLLTQELDLEKLLARILRVSIEMLAGQAGLIALKEAEGWRVAAAHKIQPAFLSYLEPLLAEGKDKDLDVRELNRMLKELTYTASLGLLNGTGLPLAAHDQRRHGDACQRGAPVLRDQIEQERDRRSGRSLEAALHQRAVHRFPHP